MKHRTIPAALALAMMCASCDRDDSTSVVAEVSIELQVVSLPEGLALTLVPDLRDPRRVERAFGEIQKIIAEKRAILVGWPIIITKSGQRAVVEQIDELRYPTEFDLPGKTTTTQGPAAPPTEPADPAKPDKITTMVGVSDGGPTAFETRNVGVTLEVEPVIGPDGETIDLNLVPQHVKFLGWEKATVERGPSGETITVPMPRIFTNKITTSMTFRNGERKLIGLYKVPEPAGNVELFILRVDLLKKKVTMPRSMGGPNGPLSGRLW